VTALLSGIICPGSGGVVSLIGAGGKTTLMFRLARELRAAGRTVLTTTTTRIFLPADNETDALIMTSDPEEVLRQVRRHRGDRSHVTAGAAVTGSGKLTGFAPEAIRMFAASGLFDWIVVEADGSARRPLKAPADHEPVIPSASTAVVAVAGLDAVGKPFSDGVVFRAGTASAVMGHRPGEKISEEAVARLIAHPCGGFRGATPDARRIVFLNKADDPEREASGARIAGLLQEHSPAVADTVVVGALGAGRIAAVFRLEGK